MKKIIYFTALSVMISGSLFTSCASNEKKVENAQANVEDAKQDLTDAKNKLAAEYPMFKSDAEKKIAENEKRINSLKAKPYKTGNAELDETHQTKIDNLEKKNAELRNRLYTYEHEHSDWQEFKRGFNLDLDAIDNAFKDLDKDKGN